MLTLWGARSSGKTVFLVTLYHEILFNTKKKWRIQPCDERSTKFIEQAHTEMFKEHIFPEPSPLEDLDQRMFKFDIQMPGIFGKRSRDIQFDFLDPGGEIFEKPELDAVYGNIVFNTIRESDGLICLLDSSNKKEHEYFSLFIKNFQKLKNTFNSGRGFFQIPIPVALCVTKMDNDDNFVNGPEEFDIDAYTRELVGEAPFQMLTTHMKDYKIFGVSSVGWDKKGTKNYLPAEDGKIRPIGEINPVNVIESVEWLLRKSAH